MQNIKSSN